MTAETEATEAIEVVARHMASRLLFDSERLSEEWENYPDIGEDDWTEVVRAALGLFPFPPWNDYTAAYRLLSDRADRWIKENNA